MFYLVFLGLEPSGNRLVLGSNFLGDLNPMVTVQYPTLVVNIDGHKNAPFLDILPQCGELLGTELVEQLIFRSHDPVSGREPHKVSHEDAF